MAKNSPRALTKLGTSKSIQKHSYNILARLKENKFLLSKTLVAGYSVVCSQDFLTLNQFGWLERLPLRKSHLKICQKEGEELSFQRFGRTESQADRIDMYKSLNQEVTCV